MLFLDWDDFRREALLSTCGEEELDEDRLPLDRVYDVLCAGMAEQLRLDECMARIGTALPQTLSSNTGVDELFWHHNRHHPGPPIATITEVCGIRGTGKTHYGLQLARSCLRDGPANRALWIDCRSASAFLHQNIILSDEHLSRMHTAKAHSPPELFIVLNKVFQDAPDNAGNLRLIVIDDLHLAFLNYPEQGRLLRRLSQKLRWMMAQLACFVVITLGVWGDDAVTSKEPGTAGKGAHGYRDDEWMKPLLRPGWSWAVDQRIILFFAKSDGLHAAGADQKRVHAVLSKCNDRSGNCRPFGRVALFR